MIIDDFPFDLALEGEQGEVILFHEGTWMGPVTEETEAARLKGLKAAWIGADARRLEHAERLKKYRYTGPTHQNGVTDEHRANNSKAQMGNQNARKKPQVGGTHK